MVLPPGQQLPLLVLGAELFICLSINARNRHQPPHREWLSELMSPRKTTLYWYRYRPCSQAALKAVPLAADHHPVEVLYEDEDLLAGEGRSGTAGGEGVPGGCSSVGRVRGEAARYRILMCAPWSWVPACLPPHPRTLPLSCLSGTRTQRSPPHSSLQAASLPPFPPPLPQ